MPKTTDDITIGRSTMSLFTGHPGSRKTCAAASYPGPIYFWDFDGRIAPIKKVFPDRKDIFYDTYSSFEAALRTMKEWQLNGPPISPTGEPYRTTVADSLTTISKTIIRDAKRLLRPGGNKNQKGLIQVAEIEDYNREVAGLEELLSFLKTMNEDYGMNTILTAHLLIYEEAVAGSIGKSQVKSQVLTAGKKVAPYIPAVFDEVYHFEVEGGMGDSHCYAYTDIFGDHFAKTALPLPYRIDFTGKPFYEEIVSSLKSNGIVLDDVEVN